MQILRRTSYGYGTVAIVIQNDRNHARPILTLVVLFSSSRFFIIFAMECQCMDFPPHNYDAHDLGWNGMSGTLPHELSLFSDTLKDLNIAGGSMSGTIPLSLTKLTNLEALVINDNCFSGDLPEQINPIDLPKLSILAIHMNNYGITPQLGTFCDGSGGRVDGVIALAADCPAEEFLDDNNGNLTLAETAPYGCDCCICCYPEQYQCQDLASGGSWTSYFLNEVSPEGYPLGFATTCVSEEQESWIAENCPCLINITNCPVEIPFLGACTIDCSQEGAIPSYDFGASSSRRQHW